MNLPLWAEGLWWIASLALLELLHRRVHRDAQAVLLLGTWNSKIAFALYVAILFPGVAFHEVSHWLAAKLLGVRVRSFSLRPRREGAGSVRLGYVTTDRADPLRSALIGLAPTVAGTAILLLAFSASGLAAVSTDALRTGEVEAVLRKAADILITPTSGVWIYLALVVGNNMLPSAADRSAWWAALVFLGGVLAILVLFGSAEWVASWAVPPLQAMMRALAGAFSLVGILDLGLLGLLWALRRALEILTGRRVVEVD